MIALGEVVIIGGGCYGSFYAGQLAKARVSGRVTWRRLLLIDRDPACQVTAQLDLIPDATLVVQEWASYLESWLAVPRAEDDQIVPSPLMPHLLAQWLESRARATWPTHQVAMVPATESLGTPFDWLHPGDGVRYVSFADWLCPTHCIEPATCPAIGAPRSWEMGDAVTAWTEARRAERPTAGPALFTCRHVVHGVGMYPARLAAEAFAMLSAQLELTPEGADLVVGSVSACHGAVGILRVTGPEPTPPPNRSIFATQQRSGPFPDFRMTAPTRTETLVIIGSGPAAWTAAIYAARANLDPVVYEGEPSREMIPGGQLMWTTDIDNFPGFHEGVDGQGLMDRMKQQAVRFGTRVVSENIASADLAQRPFVLRPSWSEPVAAKAVIVATGARAIWLDVPNEARLAQSGGGVSACAVCDGALPFFRDKVLAVVGGGDSAMEEATYLTKFAREVVIIHRRDSFRASKVMADRALNHPKIRVEWYSQVTEVLGDDEITGVRLRDTRTGDERTLEVGGLFVAIGHTPNTAFLEGQLATTPAGYIETPTSWRTETTVEGVFAAGDVIDEYYRQAVTSAGSGCMAALEAERWLAHHEA